MYSRCIFTYNNTFYNDILNERTKLFLLRDNVLKRNIQIKLISKNTTMALLTWFLVPLPCLHRQTQEQSKCLRRNLAGQVQAAA